MTRSYIFMLQKKGFKKIGRRLKKRLVGRRLMKDWLEIDEKIGWRLMKRLVGD